VPTTQGLDILDGVTGAPVGDLATDSSNGGTLGLQNSPLVTNDPNGPSASPWPATTGTTRGSSSTTSWPTQGDHRHRGWRLAEFHHDPALSGNAGALPRRVRRPRARCPVQRVRVTTWWPRWRHLQLRSALLRLHRLPAAHAPMSGRHGPDAGGYWEAGADGASSRSAVSRSSARWAPSTSTGRSSASPRLPTEGATGSGERRGSSRLATPLPGLDRQPAPQRPIVGMSPTPMGGATGWWQPTGDLRLRRRTVLRVEGGHRLVAPVVAWHRRRHGRLLGGGGRRRSVQLQRRILRIDRRPPAGRAGGRYRAELGRHATGSWRPRRSVQLRRFPLLWLHGRPGAQPPDRRVAGF